MPQRRYNTHPWTRFGQFVKEKRTPTFVQYLETLPPEERKRIEAAEREYVAKTLSASNWRQSVERDFGKCMLGVNEYVPAKHGAAA